jgi:uncharacterized protein DUF6496
MHRESGARPKAVLGAKGGKVESRTQAIAIGLSKAREQLSVQQGGGLM